MLWVLEVYLPVHFVFLMYNKDTVRKKPAEYFIRGEDHYEKRRKKSQRTEKPASFSNN